MKTWTQSWRPRGSFAAGLIFVLALVLPQPSTAQDGVPRVIPYDGFLTDSGQVIDGSMAIRFMLYNMNDELIWYSEHSDDPTRSCRGVSSCLVPLYRGMFSVLLGEYVSIESVLTGVTAHVEAEDAGADGNVEHGGTWYKLHSNTSTVTLSVDPVFEGTYTLAVRAYEDHLGDESVNMAVRVDGVAVANVTVDAPSFEAAEIYTVDLTLGPTGASQTIEIAMTNDLFIGGDRNLHADWMQLSGGYPLEDVYLGMAVRDEGGSWVPLEGRQLIVAQPYALWASEGSDFTVGGRLTVGGFVASGNLVVEGGSLTVRGDVTLGGAIDSPSLSGGSVTADGALTVSSNASAGGALNVTGPVCFSSCDAAGGRVLVHDAGNTLTMNDANDFAGGTRIDGSVSVSGDLITDGNVVLGGDLVTPTWRIDGDRPWMVTGSVDMQSYYRDLEFSFDDWFCWIGGYIFGPGDINESSSLGILELHTYGRTDEVDQRLEWAIRADFVSQFEHEAQTVSYVCVQRAMVDIQSWLF